MEPRKQAIMDALDVFVRQRAGLEFCNYGDWKSYRAEQRSITRDLHHYRELARYVTWRESITADMLLEAARSAYSGRLTITEARDYKPGEDFKTGLSFPVAAISYCTGQYFPTEYRRAACAVLASAIWAAMREDMPAPTEWRVQSWGAWNGARFDHETSKPLQIHAACELLQQKGGEQYGHVQEYHDGKTPGDWLRSKARREFGRSIASRWFN